MLGGTMISFDDVVNHPEIKELMKNAQKQLDVLGYTEHSRQTLHGSGRKSKLYFRTVGV